MKKIMLGNEAIARGAYEAGVKVATGYPGTPSTEIMQCPILHPIEHYTLRVETVVRILGAQQAMPHFMQGRPSQYFIS